MNHPRSYFHLSSCSAHPFWRDPGIVCFNMQSGAKELGKPQGCGLPEASNVLQHDVGSYSGLQIGFCGRSLSLAFSEALHLDEASDVEVPLVARL